MAVATSTAMLIAAAATVGATVYSSQQQKKAADEARASQQRAADEARAMNQAAADKQAADAAMAERDANRKRAGRSSTVLTSNAGYTSTASTAIKTLLGG